MPHKIEIQVDKLGAGALDLSSIKAAMEEGVVLGIGDDVSLPIKIGDKIKFKSFGMDIYNDGTCIIDERTLCVGKKL